MTRRSGAEKFHISGFADKHTGVSGRVSSTVKLPELATAPRGNGMATFAIVETFIR